MKDQQLRIIIEAEDRAKQAFDGVDRNLKSLSGKLDGLAPTFTKMSIAGTAAFTAITGAIALSIKETIDSEAAQNRLTHILRTSRGATDEQVAPSLRP
jgi:hypothetical protein